VRETNCRGRLTKRLLRRIGRSEKRILGVGVPLVTGVDEEVRDAAVGVLYGQRVAPQAFRQTSQKRSHRLAVESLLGLLARDRTCSPSQINRRSTTTSMQNRMNRKAK